MNFIILCLFFFGLMFFGVLIASWAWAIPTAIIDLVRNIRRRNEWYKRYVQKAKANQKPKPLYNDYGQRF